MVKHSKFSNTGYLFETLVRTITSETLSGVDSKALSILRKYFSKTELGREYKLYETLIKRTNLSEGKADIIINTVLENAKLLNRSVLKRQKYNLIKEIKEHYNLEAFFKTKLPHYKSLAAIYTLLEIYNTDSKLASTEQAITNKLVLLEHLTSTSVKSDKTDDFMEEYKTLDKDTRIITYQVLLEKFNEKYDGFNNNQKIVLKEFINSVDNTSKLKEFYNSKVVEIKNTLLELNKTTKEKSTEIKIGEVVNILCELGKNDKISNNNMVNLLQYYDLIEELQK